MPVSVVAVAGRSSRNRKCSNTSHLPLRVSHREEMPSLRSWSGTNRRARDSLRAMRAVRSTVRPTQGANVEASRNLRGRKDQLMNTHIYTPRLKKTGERLRLKLNDADWVVANR